jgi:hypothetical protein
MKADGNKFPSKGSATYSGATTGTVSTVQPTEFGVITSSPKMLGTATLSADFGKRAIASSFGNLTTVGDLTTTSRQFGYHGR